MPEKTLDIYSALKPVYVVSRVLGLVPFAYGKTISNTKTRSFVHTLFGGIVFFLVLGWYISSITFDCLYHFSKHTSMYIIPLVSRMSAVFGATLAALIICHRGTLQHLCQKLLLIDQILLVSQETYKMRRLMTTAEIVAVLSVVGAIHVFDMQDRNLDYTTTIEIAGWVLASYINSTFILQFLSCVRVVKNRFGRLNAHLSSMIVRDSEEEELHAFLSDLNISSRRLNQWNEEGHHGRGFHITSGCLCKNTVRSETRSRVFIYDPAQINSLRLTHTMLYKLTKVINSDFGIHILLEMLQTFISLIMSMYIAMTGRTDPHLTNCRGDANCVRVVIHYCIAAVCITKFVAVTAFCHAANGEMARTPELVQSLLLRRPLGTDTLAEFQLFSQQISNIDTKFTAFGFFTLNFKLLGSVAVAATTYIVILIQSTPMAGA
jgi:hypothetical protein